MLASSVNWPSLDANMQNANPLMLVVCSVETLIHDSRFRLLALRLRLRIQCGLGRNPCGQNTSRVVGRPCLRKQSGLYESCPTPTPGWTSVPMGQPPTLGRPLPYDPDPPLLDSNFPVIRQLKHQT